MKGRALDILRLSLSLLRILQNDTANDEDTGRFASDLDSSYIHGVYHLKASRFPLEYAA